MTGYSSAILKSCWTGHRFLRGSDVVLWKCCGALLAGRAEFFCNYNGSVIMVYETLQLQSRGASSPCAMFLHATGVKDISVVEEMEECWTPSWWHHEGAFIVCLK